MSAVMGEIALERPYAAMNHMDAQTKAVHIRLEEWGRWARDGNIRAWPQATLLARVIECGPVGAIARAKESFVMPESVAHVDAAIVRLGDIDRRVIRRYYLDWAPRDVMARSMGMRMRAFSATLQRARWRVSGYLSAMGS